ncbi:MAG: YbaB/EbfC family nucleoid-associated protein [Balneolales bacterium]
MQNMADLFGKITEFQKKMEDAKSKLSELEIEAEAGGGMVKVKANGNREIIGIKLDHDIINKDDVEMLEDLIIAGINKALNEAEDVSREKMAEMTKGMLPGGLPGGMDLGDLGLK